MGERIMTKSLRIQQYKEKYAMSPDSKAVEFDGVSDAERVSNLEGR